MTNTNDRVNISPEISPRTAFAAGAVYASAVQKFHASDDKVAAAALIEAMRAIVRDGTPEDIAVTAYDAWGEAAREGGETRGS